MRTRFFSTVHGLNFLAYNLHWRFRPLQLEITQHRAKCHKIITNLRSTYLQALIPSSLPPKKYTLELSQGVKKLLTLYNGITLQGTSERLLKSFNQCKPITHSFLKERLGRVKLLNLCFHIMI